MRITKAAVALAVLQLAFAPHVIEASSLDNWAGKCEIDAMTDEKSCNVTYATVHKDKVVTVSVTKLENKWMFVIVASSLGIVDKCAMRVDSFKAVKTSTVYRGACVFSDRKVDTEELVDQFRRGSLLLLRVYTYRGYDDIRVSLKGFSRSLHQAGW